MDEEKKSSEISDFVADGYLSSAQIEIVRSKREGNSMGETDLLELIDGFVRANGKADAKYEDLLKQVRGCLDLLKNVPLYPERISGNFLFAYGILFGDYLYLVGAFDENDIEEAKAKAFGGSGMGVNNPWGNKA